MKALILVDLQNDFMPGGAMPVPHGHDVIPLANRLQGRFKFVVATQEWRPVLHRSFAENYEDRKPGDVVVVRKQARTLLPLFCVQNSRGAKLAPGLMLNRVNKVVRKGTDPEVDSYSGFFDQDHMNATGLSDYLRDKRVTEVFILGLPTESTVKQTALDAVALGYKTRVIEDACRGLERKPGDVAKALAEMKEAGVLIVSSKEILKIPGKA